MKRIVMATVLCLLMALLAVPNAAKADTGTVEGCIRFSSASPFSVGTYFQDWNGTIEYSQDGNTWTTWDGSDVDATFDGTLYTLSLRGIGNTKLSSMNRMKIFKLDGTAISCDGNIENLLDYQKVANNQHPGMASYCFSGLFVDCTSLVKAPELPATKLAQACYFRMFSGCTSLTGAPALPATELADNCYSMMFGGCKSLTGAPELPAKKLTMGCYNGMFVNCTSLVTPPALPATELQIGCYNSMFAGCTSLTTAPALPAKKAPLQCYYMMFENCVSLTTAPALPATELASRCYCQMFYLCRSLTTAPELPATKMADNCYYEMFYGCTSLTMAPALPATELAASCYERMLYSTGIALSETRTEEYNVPWRIPTTGVATEVNKWNRMMTTFSNGPFKDEPQIGVTYYQKGITPAPAPEAGDTSHPALLIGLAVLALCGIAVTAVQRRKCER